MQENEQEKIKISRDGGADFLYEIYFRGESFFRQENFGFSSLSPSTGKRRVGDRGPDRQPRKQRPWLLGQAKHARILELLREGRSKVMIAKELGVGVQTVQRRAAILRREDDEPGTVDFRAVRGEVCERHGPVTVWPCVQCLAEEAKRTREAKERESN